VSTGRELACKLRNQIKVELGSKSEHLVQFGIAPSARFSDGRTSLSRLADVLEELENENWLIPPWMIAEVRRVWPAPGKTGKRRNSCLDSGVVIALAQARHGPEARIGG